MSQTDRIYSGASPEKVAADLAPLVNFRNEGLPLHELDELLQTRLVPHLMRYDRPEFQSMFNAFLEEGWRNLCDGYGKSMCSQRLRLFQPGFGFGR